MHKRSIKFKQIRCGTTKGLFIEREDLPHDENEMNEVLERIFDSGKMFQLDGIGGGNQYSNKVIIIENTDNENVFYRFGQLGTNKRFIDWRGNDGNLTAGIAIYAMEKGIGNVVDGTFKVNAVNSFTKDLIQLSTKFNYGKPVMIKDYENGYDTYGVEVKCLWINPGGGIVGKRFPTGNVKDRYEIEEKIVEFSIVDCVSLVVMINSNSIYMVGKELPGDESEEMIYKSNQIRAYASLKSGFTKDLDEAQNITLFPLLATISEPINYVTSRGQRINYDEYDLRVNIISLNEIHHAISISAAICIAYASLIEGTIPNQIIRGKLSGKGHHQIRIGHPSGIVRLDLEKNKDKINVIVNRNCRILSEGKAFVSY